MSKVAIFTEGQSELIFLRCLLHLTFGYETISYKCLKLYADTLQDVPHSYNVPNPLVEFLLINVGNDDRVLSAIKERESNFFNKGYEEIIGLRDMYSEEYRKRSEHIDISVTNAFIQAHRAQIQELSNPSKIHIFFSIMELEAWLLSMYNLFSKIHPSLTVDFIEQCLGFNLRQVDSETEFFHPTNTLNDILGLIGQIYNKGSNQIESIISNIGEEDVNNALENNRCSSFSSFLEKINSYKQ